MNSTHRQLRIHLLAVLCLSQMFPLAAVSVEGAGVIQSIIVSGSHPVGPHENDSPIKLDPTLPAPKKLTQALDPYLSCGITDAILGRVADTVVDHLKQQDWPMVVVSIEEEGEDHGRVVVAVTQGRLGPASILGGNLGRQRQAAKVLQPLVGSPLTWTPLQSRLDWLNRFPAWQVQAQPVPGPDLLEMGLHLDLQVEHPFSFRANYENNGVQPLGIHRYTSALSWDNALGLGQVLSLQGTVGSRPEDFWLLAGLWRIPLPWHHELRLSGYYAESASSTQLQDLELAVGGMTQMLSGHYLIPMRWSSSWRSEGYLGFDWKAFDTDLTFGGFTALTNQVGVGQVLLGHRVFWEREKDHLQWEIELHHGREGWVPNQSTAIYQQLTRGADATFTYLRTENSYLRQWSGDWQTLVRSGGQWSDGVLLPSEAFGLASMNYVRGYPERSVLASRAAWVSAECHAPSWMFNQETSSRLQARPFGFVDAGWGFEPQCGCSQAEQTSTRVQTLTSVGLGLRGQILGKLQAHCEIAWPLTERSEPRMHLGATLTF